jgi:hypothetical protein
MLPPSPVEGVQLDFGAVSSVALEKIYKLVENSRFERHTYGLISAPRPAFVQLMSINRLRAPSNITALVERFCYGWLFLTCDEMRFPFLPVFSRARLRLTAWLPSRARRSPAFCFLGTPAEILPKGFVRWRSPESHPVPL